MEEIKNELKDQHVIDVKNITIYKNNQIIKTNTYIITFNQQKIPANLKISYEIIKVKQYVPNPIDVKNMVTRQTIVKIL